MPRLFVAVWPPPQVVARLSGLPRPERPGVRWIPTERWHVTLQFLGAADPEEVVAALDRATFHRARAELGPAVATLGEEVVVVPVAGVEALAATVAAATSAWVAPGDTRPYLGHLTLARIRPGTECPVVGEPVRAGFEVTEVALVQSRGGGAALGYETVATWPAT